MYAGVIPSNDITYFFKPQVEDQRRVRGHKTNGMVPTPSGFLENEFVDGFVSRPMDGTRRIVIGSIVYDDTTGTATHDIRITHARDIRRRIRSYGIEPMTSNELAGIMQREAILGLAEANPPMSGGFTSEILEMNGGYYVIVSINPDAPKDIPDINSGIAQLVNRLSDVSRKTH